MHHFNYESPATSKGILTGREVKAGCTFERLLILHTMPAVDQFCSNKYPAQISSLTI